MKIKDIKRILSTEIHKVAGNISLYCHNPKSDFTRNRKLPAETLLKSIIGMENKSLTNELIDLFHSSPDMPTKSAFVQQRNKIKPNIVFFDYKHIKYFQPHNNFSVFTIIIFTQKVS